MFSASDVAVVRHVVQRILVPCVFVIGLVGNSVSIYVLTRKRMRCTTNIYLTALAITDIIYLAMALLLSFKHYDYVQRHCKVYWQCYGVVVWLCDACAYISIYIAVCFTIERFIAIRYPLKRQTFCTESLAKKVITGVVFFCILSTISTAFEHEYSINSKLIGVDGEPCNTTLANAPERLTALKTNFNDESSTDFEGSGYIELRDVPSATKDVEESLRKRKEMKGISRKVKPELILRRLKRETEMTTAERPMSIDATNVRAAATHNIPKIASDLLALAGSHSDFLLDAEFLVSVTTPILKHQKEHPRQKHFDMDDDTHAEEIMQADASATQIWYNGTVVFNVTDFCENVTYYQNTNSNLAQNVLYQRIWNSFTLFVFVLIPLCVLATFNCFLIMLVRRSKNLRGEMTNASSMRRSKRKPHMSSVSQENRVTVTLIAVVLLFIVCQLPWAIYLIVSENIYIDGNLQAIIGNIFNFLAAINAAANFFLYCVLSDKYRKTVRELITGYRYKAQRNTNNSLYASTHTAVINGSRRYRPATSSMVIK